MEENKAPEIPTDRRRSLTKTTGAKESQTSDHRHELL